MKEIQTATNKHSYIAIDLNSLKVGENAEFSVLIRGVNNYIIIVEAGTVLSEQLYEKLKKQDKLYISKRDEFKLELTCKTLNSHVKHYKDDLKKSLGFLYDINNKLFADFLDSTDDKLDITCLEEIVKSIIFLIKQHPNYLKETMTHFSSDYAMAYHSLHVSIYAIHLAYYLKLNDDQLLQIGTAGLLLEIGNKKINDSIKHKDSKLSEEELKMIQRHINYSAEIAKKNYVNNPYIIEAIMHHHEAQDGTGYPEHLKNTDISNFASILSISDVFDALTSDRPYREKNTTFEALIVMMKEGTMANKFNQKYLKVFLKSLVK